MIVMLKIIFVPWKFSPDERDKMDAGALRLLFLNSIKYF
jgi:hypothetical protein